MIRIFAEFFNQNCTKWINNNQQLSKVTADIVNGIASMTIKKYCKRFRFKMKYKCILHSLFIGWVLAKCSCTLYMHKCPRPKAHCNNVSSSRRTSYLWLPILIVVGRCLLLSKYYFFIFFASLFSDHDNIVTTKLNLFLVYQSYYYYYYWFPFFSSHLQLFSQFQFIDK